MTRTIDYEAANRGWPKQKAALTRAINSGDPEKVKATCKKAVNEWEKWGCWPDEWSRFQRALDDALGWSSNLQLEDLVD